MAFGSVPGFVGKRAGISVNDALGRVVSEAECLYWLTFGAAARLDGRPLFRPVVQQGYLPQIDSPVGTKLRCEPTEQLSLIIQWISDRGDTTLRQIVQKWAVPPEDIQPFLEGLFNFLVDQNFLSPFSLKDQKDHFPM